MEPINIAEEGYLEELQTSEPTQGPITTLQLLGTFEHRLPGIRERYTSGTLTDEDRQSVGSRLQSIEQERLRQIRIRMGYELAVENDSNLLGSQMNMMASNQARYFGYRAVRYMPVLMDGEWRDVPLGLGVPLGRGEVLSDEEVISRLNFEINEIRNAMNFGGDVIEAAIDAPFRGIADFATNMLPRFVASLWNNPMDNWARRQISNEIRNDGQRSGLSQLLDVSNRNTDNLYTRAAQELREMWLDPETNQEKRDKIRDNVDKLTVNSFWHVQGANLRRFANVISPIRREDTTLDAYIQRMINKEGAENWNDRTEFSQKLAIKRWTNIYNTFAERHQRRLERINDSEDRLQERLNTLIETFELDTHETSPNPRRFTENLNRVSERHRLAGEMKQSLINFVLEEQGRVTSLMDDSRLRPLSTEVYTGEDGREWVRERTLTGNLHDRQVLKTNLQGEVIFDDDGEAMYIYERSTTDRFLTAARNAFTTRAGAHSLVGMVESLATFLPTSLLIGKSGGAAIAPLLKQITAKWGKRALLLGQTGVTGIASAHNESISIGREASIRTAELLLDEYTKGIIDRDAIYKYYSQRFSGFELHQRVNNRIAIKQHKWLENNPEIANNIVIRAFAAGELARQSNYSNIALQLLPAHMINRFPGIRPASIRGFNPSMTARQKNIATGVYALLYNMPSELLQESHNHFSEEMGIALAQNRLRDFTFNFHSAENVERATIGAIMGVTTGTVFGRGAVSQNSGAILGKAPSGSIVTSMLFEDGSDIMRNIMKRKGAEDATAAAAVEEAGRISNAGSFIKTGKAAHLANEMDAIINNPESTQAQIDSANHTLRVLEDLQAIYDSIPDNLAGRNEIFNEKMAAYGHNSIVQFLESQTELIRNRIRDQEEARIRSEISDTTAQQEAINNINVESNPLFESHQKLIEFNKNEVARYNNLATELSQKPAQKKIVARDKRLKESVISNIAPVIGVDAAIELRKELGLPINDSTRGKLEIEARKPVAPKSRKEAETGITGNVTTEEGQSLLEAADGLSSIKDQVNTKVEIEGADNNYDISHYSSEVVQPAVEVYGNKARQAIAKMLQQAATAVQEFGGTTYDSFTQLMTDIESQVGTRRAGELFNLALESYREFESKLKSEGHVPTDVNMLTETEVKSQRERFNNPVQTSLYNDINVRDNRTSTQNENTRVEESDIIANTPIGKSATRVEPESKPRVFKWKIPYAAQAYKRVRDGWNKVRFVTENTQLDRFAELVADYNNFYTGKKVTLVLGINNTGHITQGYLNQLVDGERTFRDILQQVFKGQNIDTLIENHTLSELVDMEVSQRNLDSRENSAIVEMMPVNLEMAGLNPEDGLGRGMHNAGWWGNPDFTRDIVRSEGHTTKASEENAFEALRAEARRKITEKKLRLLDNGGKLDQAIGEITLGVSFQQHDGSLQSVKSQVPTAIIAFADGGVIKVADPTNKESYSKPFPVSQIINAESIGRTGATYMLHQIGTEVDIYGKKQPVYVARVVNNYTEGVSPAAKNKMKVLYETGQLILKAIYVYHSGKPTNEMSMDNAKIILSRVTGIGIQDLADTYSARDRVVKRLRNYLGDKDVKTGKQWHTGIYPRQYTNSDGSTTLDSDGQPSLRLQYQKRLSGQQVYPDITIKDGQVVFGESVLYEDMVKDNMYIPWDFRPIQSVSGETLYINNFQQTIEIVDTGEINADIAQAESQRVAAELAAEQKEKKIIPTPDEVEQVTETTISEVEVVTEEISTETSTTPPQITQGQEIHLLQNIVGRVMKEFSKLTKGTPANLYGIITEQYNKIIADLWDSGYANEAEYMEANRDRLIGKDAHYRRNSIREVVEELFHIPLTEDIEIDSGTGEIIKTNHAAAAYEVPISLSVSTKVKAFFASVKSTMKPGTEVFGNLESYIPVDNIMSIVQQAFIDSESNSLPQVLKTLEDRVENTRDKHTGKSPLEFLLQVRDMLQGAPVELAREIQYHLYTIPVKMYFAQISNQGGRTRVSIMDANSNNPEISIPNEFHNNLKNSPLLNMEDSNTYTINEIIAEAATQLYNTIFSYFKQGLGTSQENILAIQQYLSLFGIDVNTVSIALMMDPDYNMGMPELMSGHGLITKLQENLNRARKSNAPLTFGRRYTQSGHIDTGNFRDRAITGNLVYYGNKGNMDKLVEVFTLTHIDPRNSNRVAGKTINAYQQPKFLKEQLKRVLKRKSQTQRDLATAQYSRNSMVLSLLNQYGYGRQGIARLFQLDQVSLAALKQQGRSFTDKAELADLSPSDYYTLTLGLYTSTPSELRGVSFMGVNMRMAQMLFNAISDTGDGPVWTTPVMNLKVGDVTVNENNIGFTDQVLELLYSQLVLPDADRISAYNKVNQFTNIVGHDIAARMFHTIPSINGIIVNNAQGQEVTLIQAMKESDDPMSVVNTNKRLILDEIQEHINKEVKRAYTTADGVSKGYLVDAGIVVGNVLKNVNTDFISDKNQTVDSKGNTKIIEDGISQHKLTKTVLAEYVANFMLNQANINMLFSGDIAGFNSKIESGKQVINNDVTVLNPKWLREEFGSRFVEGESNIGLMKEAYERLAKEMAINLDKRSKAFISPGNRLADYQNRKIRQVMIGDIKGASLNLEHLLHFNYADVITKMSEEDRNTLIADVDRFVELQMADESVRNSAIRVVDGKPLNEFGYLMNMFKTQFPNIKDFLNINYTDAQEYTTWREHLNILLGQGRVTQEQYNKISDKLESQTRQGVNNENRLTGNEKVVFQPLKPLYAGLHYETFGEGENTYKAQRFVYIKSSSFALLPEMTLPFRGLDNLRRNLEKIQDEVQKRNPNETVRASYQSANKVGATAQGVSTFDYTTLDATGAEITAMGLFSEMTDSDIRRVIQDNTIELDGENFSIQQDKPYTTDKKIEAGERESINISTQMEDIILSNGIMEMGRVFPNKFDSKTLSDLGIDYSKNRVILPLGTSGSGKSTWIRSLPVGQFTVISPDNMRVEFTGSMDNKSQDAAIYEEVKKRTVAALLRGEQVILDSTNLQRDRRRDFIKAVRSAVPDANIEYQLMPLNPELAKQRIATDIKKGVDRANVPESTIDRHADLYVKMLQDIQSEGITPYNYLSGQDLSVIYDALAQRQQALFKQRLYRRLGLTESRLTPKDIRAYESIAQELNKRLTNNQDKDGIELVYRVAGKVGTFTKAQLKDYGLTASEVNFRFPLWLLPNKDKFETALNSYINSNSVRLKTSGYSAAVGSSAGFTRMAEGDFKSQYGSSRAELEASGVVFTDKFNERLSSQRYENGRLSHFQVLVPSKFRVNKTREDGTVYQELLDFSDPSIRSQYVNENGLLDTNKIPEELLKMFSFRIPASSHQSGSLVEIVGFLPKKMGDLAIVPGESTVQLGEDFDIDVRNFYTKNILNDADGNLRAVSQKDIQDIQAIDARYREFKAEIIEKFKDEKSLMWQQNSENIVELANIETLLESSEQERKIWRMNSPEDVTWLEQRARELRYNIFSGYQQDSKVLSEELSYTLTKAKREMDAGKVELLIDVRRAEVLNEQYIENQMLGVYLSVYDSADPQVSAMINSALNTNFVGNTAEIIDKTLSSTGTGFSYMNPSYQRSVLSGGADAMLGVSVHSNWVTFSGIAQQQSAKGVPIVLGQTDAEGIFRPMNIKFGKLVSNGELGRINALAPKGWIPRSISTINMENQNVSVDNQNLGYMSKRNENKYTINVLALMNNLGFDTDGVDTPVGVLSYASLFISQPIIRDYVALKSKYDGITGEFNKGDTETLIMQDLFKIYGQGVITQGESSMYMDSKQKDNALSNADSNALYHQLTIPDNVTQWALFENFRELSYQATNLSPVMKFFNIENTGMGLAFFDVVDRRNNLKSLSVDTDFAQGISSMVGDFQTIYSNDVATRDSLIEQGYIPIDRDFAEGKQMFVKPSTYYSHKIVNSVTTAYDLWSNLIPYDNPGIRDILNNVMLNSKYKKDSKKYKEWRKTVSRELNDYVNTSLADLYGPEGVDNVRDRLFMDRSATEGRPVQESLATVIQKLRRDGHPIMNEALFKNLQTIINKNSEPSLVTYNVSSVNSIEKNLPYRTLKAFYNDNRVITLSDGTELKANGITYTYQELVKQLLQYSMLADQEGGAIGFRKYFPIEIFDKYGISENFQMLEGKNIQDFIFSGGIQYLTDLLGSSVVGGKISNANSVSVNTLRSRVNSINRVAGKTVATINNDGSVSVGTEFTSRSGNFTRQVYQHNPTEATAIPHSDKSAILGYKKSFKDVDTFSPTALNEATIAAFLHTQEGQNIYLYELQGGVYKKINLLGGFGVSEYNAAVSVPTSLYKRNNIGEVPMEIPQIPKRTNFATRDTTLYDLMVDLHEQMPEYAPLVEVLSPYVDTTIPVRTSDVPNNANGAWYAGTLWINGMLDSNLRAKTALHETLHTTTVGLIEVYGKFILQDGEMKFIPKEGVKTPAPIITLAQVYSEAFKVLKDKIGIEEINKAIERREEWKRMHKAGIPFDAKETSTQKTAAESVDIHEFLAGIFFNPMYREVLNNVPYKKSNKTIIEKFIDVLSRVFSFLPDFNVKDGSLLEASITSLFDVLSLRLPPPDMKLANRGDSIVAESMENIDIGYDTTEEGSGINLMRRNTAINSEYIMNPQLVEIGTKTEYQKYLNTIFPNSQMRDIVYHGTTEFIGDSFSKDFLGDTTGDDSTASAGFHFSDRTTAVNFGIPSRLKTGKDIITIPVLLNMQNKKSMDNMGELRGTVSNPLNPIDVVNNLKGDGYDSIHIKSYQGGPDFIVFEPNQIHILGSEQDIKGFREWKGNRKLHSVPIEVASLEMVMETGDFLGTPVEISLARDIEISNDGDTLIVNIELMRENFVPSEMFNTFDQWFAFSLLVEQAKINNQQGINETLGEYSMRIQEIAETSYTNMGMLSEIRNPNTQLSQNVSETNNNKQDLIC